MLVSQVASGPVKIVLERRAGRGGAAALDAWTRDVMATARRGGALEGSSVLERPDGERIVLLRFAGQADLDGWQSSPDVVELLSRDDTVSVAGARTVVRCGLETWFQLPGGKTPSSPPPKWKMALVTWLALMPQIIALSYVVPKSLPLLASVAVSTAIPVSVLTWIAMPRLTRLLESWLYPPHAPETERGSP